MAFGQRLRELREAKKLTQGQLAEAAGLSKGSVANLEQGFRRTPAWDTLQKLAAALGVAVDAFTEPATPTKAPGRGRPKKAAETASAPKVKKPARKRKGSV